MSDYSELKRLAEAANGCWHGTQQFCDFKKAVTPVLLMDLIAENQALRKERDRLAEDNRGLLEDFEGAL